VNSNDAPETPEAEAPAPTAGMILQQAREAAGLTIDDVALQLKLARARSSRSSATTSRTCPAARSSAASCAITRLLKLDTDAVLGAPTGEHATPAERTPLAATSRAMGEMPIERRHAPTSHAGRFRWCSSPSSPSPRSTSSRARRRRARAGDADRAGDFPRRARCC
jgi:hypothetical protein